MDEELKGCKIKRKCCDHRGWDSVSPVGLASDAVLTSVACVQRLKMILSELSRHSITTKALSDSGMNPSSASK